MKLTSTLPAALALLISTASAASPSPQFITQACYTSQLSTKCPTSPHRSTVSSTSSHVTTVTTSVTTTVTAKKPTTKTSTLLSTAVVTVTAPATTGTAFVTTTSTEIDTITQGTTVTETATATVDGGVSTSTVPADPSFTPLSDSIPGSLNQYPGSTTKKQRKRNGGSSSGELTSPNPNVKRDSSNQFNSPKSYPGDVTCVRYYDLCSTKTVTRTVTQTAKRSTVSATVTSSTTCTFTSTPGVSVTSTSTVSTTTQTTVTTTGTQTSTSSVTTYSSTTTEYAACATNNIGYFVGNQSFFGGSPDRSVVVESLLTEPTSDVQCCITAILDPLTAYWVWGGFTGPAQCYVFRSQTTCAASRNSTAPAFSQYAGGNRTFGIGNANCGEWTPGS